MLNIRDEYRKIFNEIEGDDSDVKLVWPNENMPICYPKFVSKKDKQSTYTTVSLLKIADKKPNSNPSIPKDFNLIDDIEKINYLELDNLKRMSKTDLISVRESVSLEMLWIQQAIQSRIQVTKSLFLKKKI